MDLIISQILFVLYESASKLFERTRHEAGRTTRQDNRLNFLKPLRYAARNEGRHGRCARIMECS